MNFDQYKAIKAINATSIKAGQKSMLHMHDAMTGGGKDQTPAMRWGSLVHKAILEPAEFAALVCVFDGDKRSKQWKEFQAENNLEFCVSVDEKTRLEEIRDAVHSNEAAHKLITACTKEVTLEWEGDYGAAKARLDGYDVEAGIVDLKTAKNITPDGFARQFISLGYDLQIGWYAEGSLTALLRKELPSVTIIAVESIAPYDVAVYTVPRVIVELGQRRARKIAIEYRFCEAEDRFPGVSEGVKELVMPDWYGQDDICAEFLNKEGISTDE